MTDRYPYVLRLYEVPEQFYRSLGKGTAMKFDPAMAEKMLIQHVERMNFHRELHEVLAKYADDHYRQFQDHQRWVTFIGQKIAKGNPV